MENESGDEVVQPGESSPTEAYEPPAIAWQQPFDMREGLASACGKIAGSGPSECDTTPAS